MSPLTFLLNFLFVTFAFAAKWPVDSQKNPQPGYIETFFIDPQNLWYNRELIRQGRKELRSPMNRIIRIANAAVNDQTVYAVTGKPSGIVAPSGDVHDFYSNARYFWPNNSNPGGLPYVRIDGQVNPETYATPDSTWAGVVFDDVFNLGLAYFFTGDEKYAQTATTRIRQWFLDSNTKMNPNLNFASWIKGSSIGITTGTAPLYTSGATLAFYDLYKLVDGVGLIRNSKSFSNSDMQGLLQWFQQYGEWLQSAPRGAIDASASNNMGTWYDVQLASVLFFLGQPEMAAKLQQTTMQRIAQQFTANGSQPLEEIRANSWHYSVFNLRAWFIQIAFSMTTGINMISYKTPQGQSILGALDYMIQYGLVNGTNWPVPNEGEFATSQLAQLCKNAYVYTKNSKYLTFGAQLSTNATIQWNPYRLWTPFAAYDTPFLMSSSSKLAAGYLFVLFVLLQ